MGDDGGLAKSSMLACTVAIWVQSVGNTRSYCELSCPRAIRICWCDTLADAFFSWSLWLPRQMQDARRLQLCCFCCSFKGRVSDIFAGTRFHHIPVCVQLSNRSNIYM